MIYKHVSRCLFKYSVLDIMLFLAEENVIHQFKSNENKAVTCVLLPGSGSFFFLRSFHVRAAELKFETTGQLSG